MQYLLIEVLEVHILNKVMMNDDDIETITYNTKYNVVIGLLQLSLTFVIP